MSKIDTKDAVFKEFLKRCPNALNIHILKYTLPSIDTKQIKDSLDELVKEKKIEETDKAPTSFQEHANSQLPKYVKKDEHFPSYKLTSKEVVDLYLRYDYEYNNIKIPRILDHYAVSSEPINLLVEKVIEYNQQLENDFKDELDKQRKSYFSNIITIFGVFIAIFSLINVSVNKIEVDSSLGFWNIFLINFAQVLPIAIVLVVFVLILNWLFRTK